MGSLYLVATPIGNLSDLSPRALETLRQVDLIACEDTRRTRKLLNCFGISAKTTSYHEHNESSKSRQLLALLKEGQSLALVSDAGTPLLSDPGYLLVKLSRDEGIPVVPIPGPSAALAALSTSGLPTHRFLFLGFLPTRRASIRRELKAVAAIDATLIVYVSPHQLMNTLEEAARTLGPRPAFLMREITKLYESAFSGSLADIASQAAAAEPKGEYTLVIGAGQPKQEVQTGIDVTAYVEGLKATQKCSQRDAVAQASEHLGLSKQEVYRVLQPTRTRGGLPR